MNKYASEEWNEALTELRTLRSRGYYIKFMNEERESDSKTELKPMEFPIYGDDNPISVLNRIRDHYDEQTFYEFLYKNLTKKPTSNGNFGKKVYR